MTHTSLHGRRTFVRELTRLSACAFASVGANRVRAEQEGDRPVVESGVASGDVTFDGAMIWSRSDRPARMLVEIAQDRSFRRSRKLVGPDALDGSDYTAKFPIRGLPPGTRTFYRVRFEDLAGRRRISDAVTGQFLTAPDVARDVTFVWSGDTAGQGYGIDLARGGMLTYDAMRRIAPDFFVHSGDTCYSDNPFPKAVLLDDGTTWSNVTTDETSKVAETIDEFRANFRYNLLDEHVRRFQAEVPVFAQWDDHETTNNWYPGEILEDDRYTEKSASLLAARAKQAFFEYFPIRESVDGTRPVHRTIPYGPLLQLFFLDMRTFRGPNSTNDQPEAGPDTALLGDRQIERLKSELSKCRSTWKVICSDMPLGLVVRDGADRFEAVANGDGPPRGRELEIASLLRFIKRQGISNVVWLTADVHYAASHFYDPNAAVFSDFHPFWEFVSGPLHAGTFGPNALDDTFGPQVRFCSVPDDLKPNRPPSDGLQFFGVVRIDAQTRTMTVSHRNQQGETLWSVDLAPNPTGR